MSEGDPFFEEFDRIAEDRHHKDYWGYAKALSNMARIFKDHHSSWIAEEFKHLRFYCDMLAPCTNGTVHDKIQRHEAHLKDLEEKSIRLLMEVETFARHVENRQAVDLTDLPALRARYKNAIEPIEHLMDVELAAIRMFLQSVLDTIRSEHPKAGNHE